MPDLDDFDLGKTADRPPEEGGAPREPEGSGRGLRAGLAAGVLLLAVGIAAILALVFRRPPAAKAPPPPPPIAEPAPAPAPTPALALPPLDASDAFVREAAKGLSSHAQLALWLGARELVRTLAAVVDNVAAGDNPAPHLALLAPRDRFSVVEKRSRTVIDPRSYARWDAFAQGVAAIDASECARVFGLLEPLLEAAWRELGHPEPFRRGVARATAALLEVPVIEAEVAVAPVVRAVRVYEYADPRLERLKPAQKLLLRMGPANVARIQAKLREVQAALGGPPPSGP